MTTPDTKELVERYDASAIMMGIDGIEEKPSPNGKWVRYSDYQALATALEAMQRENARLTKINADHCRTVNTYIRDNSRQEDARVAAEAQLTALKAEVEGLREAWKSAVELAEYASYAEIVGAIHHNRAPIRKFCDEVLAVHRKEQKAEWDRLAADHEARAALNGGTGK